jgi:hypothetical protein
VGQQRLDFAPQFGVGGTQDAAVAACRVIKLLDLTETIGCHLAA